ncbi:hypothetical protein BBO_07776 [Beauveria brongniartii RCEF 3172]|uniref:Uncharacterized protein n=1 Tax=Beauveria brongniartii RCEF 3172 TaxID=1081107 RepID=A0A166YMT6_9HYPO|nr:hypothetical protein BBO_07776 [Beauveria brongniartii RCEF 3172]
MGKLQKKQEALAEQSSDVHNLATPEYTSTVPSFFPDDDNDDDNTPSAPPPGYTPGPSPYRRVPVGWNLYYKPWSMRTYHIGPHADQPVFSLELHSGLLSSRPFLILLATAHRDGLFKGHAAITLLEPPLTEKLTVHTRRLSFSFPISSSSGGGGGGGGGGKGTTNAPPRRRQDFEWRYSHGKEVRALDRWGQGWKLVHLESDDGGREGGSGGGGSSSSSSEGKTTTTTRRMERPHGETSDGRPVVAVLADNSKWSRTKLARFHFVGAGATDEFGEAWALYVTMTALRIWEMMMMNAGAAGGSA